MPHNLSSSLLFGAFGADGKVIKAFGVIGSGAADPAFYYRKKLNEEVGRRWGSRPVKSLTLPRLTSGQRWKATPAGTSNTLAAGICDTAARLVNLGAKGIVLCTSGIEVPALYYVARVPILTLANSTAEAVRAAKIKRIGLLGTQSPAEDLLWRTCFQRVGLADVFVPTEKDRDKVARVIIEELRPGIVRLTSAMDLTRVVYSLRQAGGRAVVLAAPELACAFAHTENVLPTFEGISCAVNATFGWWQHLAYSADDAARAERLREID